MNLSLKFVGDECLTTKSEEIKDISKVKDLVSAMKTRMVQWNGIGLAAPQVGHNVRLMVIQLGNKQIVELINPKITWESDAHVKMEEGCLSIPGEFEWVMRPAKVKVKFQNVSGEYKYWTLSGMDARVFLHEYDHLEGILMTDRL